MTAQKRILVADDSKDIRDFFHTVLSMGGDHVDTVADGREAYFRATAEAYDLILADYDMPEMDGIELARRLVDEHNYRGRLVLATARDYISLREKARNSGIDDIGRYFSKILLKPASVAELKELSASLHE